MYCSNCNSADIRKLSLVYESGLSFVNTTTTGVGYAGAFGVGGAQTKGTQITAISAKAAPPKKKSASAALAWLIITGILGLVWHWWFVGTALAFAAILSVSDYNKKKWPPLFEAWDRQYMCGRCGAIMVPSLKAPILVETPPESVQTIQHEHLPSN